MIIVSMGAGLGNQMFEYALIIKLRRLYPEQEIKADTRYAFPFAHNGIEIFDIFGISEEAASKEEVIRLAGRFLLNGEGFEKKGIFSKIVSRMGLHPVTMFIQKDNTEYYDIIERLDRNKSYYLYGPFANYRYFKDIEKNIRELYRFPEIKDERNLGYAEHIKNTNSVSIHIRRGDYISLGIPVASKEFYCSAVDIISEKIMDPVFFVFSDDPGYAKSIFSGRDNYVFVEGNVGTESYRDMQLMSMCRHNITANSTFSFWGAFLNGNMEKIVVAPALPFKGKKNAFVCDDWIVI